MYVDHSRRFGDLQFCFDDEIFDRSAIFDHVWRDEMILQRFDTFPFLEDRYDVVASGSLSGDIRVNVDRWAVFDAAIFGQNGWH